MIFFGPGLESKKGSFGLQLFICLHEIIRVRRPAGLYFREQVQRRLDISRNFQSTAMTVQNVHASTTTEAGVVASRRSILRPQHQEARQARPQHSPIGPSPSPDSSSDPMPFDSLSTSGLPASAAAPPPSPLSTRPRCSTISFLSGFACNQTSFPV